MKTNGVIFVALVVAVIGLAKLVWSYVNLFYEVQDLRRKLGKE